MPGFFKGKIDARRNRNTKLDFGELALCTFLAHLVGGGGGVYKH